MKLIIKSFNRFLIISSNGIIFIKKCYWKFLYKNRFNIGSKLSIGSQFVLNYDTSNSVISIANGCQFRSFNRILSGNNSRLLIEKNVFFNYGCSINCLFSIKIGANTQFGENVCLYDHNHNYKNLNVLISDQGYSFGEIKIGSNCWIGSNVTILKGVEIGDNVVIGAGCIIHKSIPANTVVYNKQELIQKILS